MMNSAKALLMGLAMTCGMASCGNDDSVVTQEGSDGLDGLDMELTYTVGEAQTDSVFTRTTPARVESDKQTFMGMEVETTVMEDKGYAQAAKSPGTRATVYNTVDLEGKTVYAFVYDPSTNKTVANMQTLTVTGGKLTVRGKRGCKILFYIGIKPSVSKGKDLSTVTVNQNSSTDPMRCESDVITSPDQNLGTLSFKHLFSKLRVTLRTSNGAIVNAFKLTTKEKIDYKTAKVNVFNGNCTRSSSGSVKTFAVSGNTTSSAVADYQTLITDHSGATTDLTLVFAPYGEGATIGGAKNWLTSVNDTLKLKSRTFLPGHRYSINITVKPANTESYLNSGFRADRNFYQWDAYEPYGTGDSLSWSAGNSGARFLAWNSAYNGKDIASQSCKNCPSYTEMQMYLGAGVLADDGHSGAYQQSYTCTDPDTGEKITYHAGVWVKKKQYISGFSDGTAPKATSSSATGRPTAETINQYFFLPHYGLCDITNYNNSSASNYHRHITYRGNNGFYASRTARSSGYLWTFNTSSTGASITPLGWTRNNLCATTIVSVSGLPYFSLA